MKFIKMAENHFKVFKKTLRKYYKWQNWTQPVLTADDSSPEMIVSATTIMGANAAAWKAFDGDNSGSSRWLTQNLVGTGSLRVQFNSDMLISSITIGGFRNNNSYCKNATIYKDINNTELIGATKQFYDATGTTLDKANTWTFGTPVRTNFLSLYTEGPDPIYWTGFTEVIISAQKLVECSEEDYEYNYSSKYKEVAPGYRQLDSVTFSNALIPTGLDSNGDYKIIFDFIPLAQSSGVVWGQVHADDDDYRFFNYGGNIYFDMGTQRLSGGTCSVGTRYKFEFGNYYVKNYGAVDNLLTGTPQTFTTPYEINIRDNITFFGMEISLNNVLLRNYVPCEEVSTGNVGIYDTVQQTFLQSQNGTSTAGNYIMAVPGGIEDVNLYYGINR